MFEQPTPLPRTKASLSAVEFNLRLFQIIYTLSALRQPFKLSARCSLISERGLVSGETIYQM